MLPRQYAFRLAGHALFAMTRARPSSIDCQLIATGVARLAHQSGTRATCKVALPGWLAERSDLIGQRTAISGNLVSIRRNGGRRLVLPLDRLHVCRPHVARGA